MNKTQHLMESLGDLVKQSPMAFSNRKVLKQVEQDVINILLKDDETYKYI